MNALPANHLALAATLKAIARGRPKPMRAHLEDAEIIMTELRQRGIRLVTFPALKIQAKKGGRKYKRTLA